MPDFTYSTGDLFAQIMPETPRAVDAWNETIGPQTDGTGKVLLTDLADALRQIRRAGFSVRKQRQTATDDAALLASLGGD